MYRVVYLMALCMFLCSTVTALSAPVNVDFQAAVLTRASSPTVIRAACRRLVWAMLPDSGSDNPAHKTPQGDRALMVLRSFILSGHNTPARIHCARDLYLLQLGSFFPPSKVRISSAYAAPSQAIVISLFHDPEPAMRAGAAAALRGSFDPDVARFLLRQTTIDPSPRVVAACLENLGGAMYNDIRRSGNAKDYDAAFRRAIGSSDARLVSSGLFGYASLHRSDAVPMLRVYAKDLRPLVRRGAINAFGATQVVNESMARFIESRLTDGDADVRDAVMLRLFRWGDHRALPAIERLAKTASTPEERASARDYAAGLRTQPVGSWL